MNLFAKKVSVLTAIFAFFVVAGTGVAAGVPWDVMFFRGLALFLLVMLVSLPLFEFAMKDKPVKPGEPKEKSDAPHP